MAIYSKNKIVAIGGGHGLGRILAALKEFGSNATGIVATTDNGGSTGRIRNCQGGIAWGDTRNCINQLITAPTISSMMFLPQPILSVLVVLVYLVQVQYPSGAKVNLE